MSETGEVGGSTFRDTFGADAGGGQVGRTPPPFPPAPPPRRRRRIWPWLLGAAFLLILGMSLFLNFVLAAVLGTHLTGTGGLREQLVTGDPLAKEKVVLVDLKGIIADSAGGFGAAGAFRSTMRQLEQAAGDGAVKAVVLVVDSPGGEVTASDVLSHRVRSVRQSTGKPVVVCMGSMATSGAYYVSASADRIFAHPTTVTGSIGVIMSLMNAQGLMEKVGLQSVVLKSAEHKDLGSPFREMSEEERALLQGVVDDLFARFKQVVAEGRNLPTSKVDALASGRIFTAQEALDAGLIDRIGYLEDAIAEAKQLANATEAKVVRYERPSRLTALLTSQLEHLGPPHTINVNVAGLGAPRTARFLYLWVLGGQALFGL